MELERLVGGIDFEDEFSPGLSNAADLTDAATAQIDDALKSVQDAVDALDSEPAVQAFAEINDAANASVAGEQAAEEAFKSMQAAMSAWDGSRIFEQASEAARGITLIGGASQLTEQELEKANQIVEQALEKYAKLGQEAPADVQRLADQIAAVRQPLDDAEEGTNNWSGALTALAGAAAALGVAALSKDALDYTGRLSDLSAQSNISVTDLQKFDFAAQQVGLSMSEVSRTATMLSARLDDAKVEKALDRIGLSAAELRQKDPGAVFTEIASKIAAIKNPAEQSSAAVDIMGRGALRLLPLLKMDLKAVGDEAVRMGGVLGEDVVAAGDKAGDALTRLEISAQQTIRNAILPLVAELVDNLPAGVDASVVALGSLAMDHLSPSSPLVTNILLVTTTLRGIEKASIAAWAASAWSVAAPLAAIATVIYAADKLDKKLDEVFGKERRGGFTSGGPDVVFEAIDAARASEKRLQETLDNALEYAKKAGEGIKQALAAPVPASFQEKINAAQVLIQGLSKTIRDDLTAGVKAGITSQDDLKKAFNGNEVAAKLFEKGVKEAEKASDDASKKVDKLTKSADDLTASITGAGAVKKAEDLAVQVLKLGGVSELTAKGVDIVRKAIKEAADATVPWSARLVAVAEDLKKLDTAGGAAALDRIAAQSKIISALPLGPFFEKLPTAVLPVTALGAALEVARQNAERTKAIAEEMDGVYDHLNDTLERSEAKLLKVVDAAEATSDAFSFASGILQQYAGDSTVASLAATALGGASELASAAAFRGEQRLAEERAKANTTAANTARALGDLVAAKKLDAEASKASAEAQAASTAASGAYFNVMMLGIDILWKHMEAEIAEGKARQAAFVERSRQNEITRREMVELYGSIQTLDAIARILGQDLSDITAFPPADIDPARLREIAEAFRDDITGALEGVREKGELATKEMQALLSLMDKTSNFSTSDESAEIAKQVRIEGAQRGATGLGAMVGGMAEADAARQRAGLQEQFDAENDFVDKRIAGREKEIDAFRTLSERRIKDMEADLKADRAMLKTASGEQREAIQRRIDEQENLLDAEKEQSGEYIKFKEAELKFDQDLAAKRQAAMDAEMEAVEGRFLRTQAQAGGLAAGIAAAYGEQIARGVDTREALENVLPAVEEMGAALERSGFQGGEAFDKIRLMAEIATDEVGGPLTDVLSNVDDALIGLNNANLLTQESFDAIAFTGVDAYNQIVQAAIDSGKTEEEVGKTREAALALAAPGLQTIWQLQKDFNFEVDAGTQALIDQALEAGLVGEQRLTDAQRQTAAQERLVLVFDRFTTAVLGALGITTELGDEGENAGRKMESAFRGASKAGKEFTEDVIKIDFDTWSEEAKRGIGGAERPVKDVNVKVDDLAFDLEKSIPIAWETAGEAGEDASFVMKAGLEKVELAGEETKLGINAIEEAAGSLESSLQTADFLSPFEELLGRIGRINGALADVDWEGFQARGAEAADTIINGRSPGLRHIPLSLIAAREEALETGQVLVDVMRRGQASVASLASVMDEVRLIGPPGMNNPLVTGVSLLGLQAGGASVSSFMEALAAQFAPILAGFTTLEEQRDYVARTRLELLASGVADDIIRPITTKANMVFQYWDGLLSTLTTKVGSIAAAPSAAVALTLRDLVHSLREDERAALAAGYLVAQHAGFDKDIEHFLAEQLKLYETAQEGDARLLTYFYGETIDAWKTLAVVAKSVLVESHGAGLISAAGAVHGVIDARLNVGAQQLARELVPFVLQEAKRQGAWQ